MTDIFKAFNPKDSGVIWGAPEGVHAAILIEIAKEKGSRPVFIAINDAAMMRMKSSLMLAGIEESAILTFPAWDCLPYDRVSPNGMIIGQRVKTLSRLKTNPGQNYYILTTINAWLQKVPPPEYFAGASLAVNVGDTLSQKDFLSFAVANGYRRCDTVREVGEFAIRGGIIDIFPSGYDDPVRLDFFAEELENIKYFDANTQKRIGDAEAISLYPTSEIVLNDSSIEGFRGRYIELFGGEAVRDVLYVSISEGRHHPGMEQMLPLFHDRLVPFSDYIDNAILLMSDEVPIALKQREEQIEDFYGARQEQISTTEDESGIWRVVPPSSMYLNVKDWQEQCANLPNHITSLFAQAEGDTQKGVDLGGRRGDLYHQHIGDDKSPSQVVADTLPALLASGSVVLAASSEGGRARMAEMVAEHLSTIPEPRKKSDTENVFSLPKGELVSAVWALEDGFTLPFLTVITEKDIYGAKLVRPQGKRRKAENFLREVSSLNTGDLVVHIEHGIGRYTGLEKIVTGGVAHDCLLILYGGGDKLFLPVENIDLLSRYGREGDDSQLDRLGNASWQSRKARIKGRIKDIAAALIKVAASRKAARAEPIIPEMNSFAEFCQRFPYTETEDQRITIDDVMGDLESGRVMDRLICGDVGFGKTEVALRAAFAVAMAGYQVAVVTPTTLLARQHGQSFTARFKGFPVKLGILSRMTEGALSTKIKKQLETGDCQIVIGTHALLSKSLKYNNLGLVIVDEEQNFGVSQKERLKTLRGDIHVLTLSATPIPRTLQMALSGVREMSIIATPPQDRLAIRTSVGAWDGVVLAEAIRRERFRGGQVFCVCPRISQLPRVYDRLLKLVPEAKIISAHGQMPPAELDKAMMQFSEGAADILLATNIIESGIDIPSANTIIIYRADMFGLSQLYQLRGRVGRSAERAYAYLMTDKTQLLTPNAKRRLQVMQTLDALGAGFTLASYDLDIRGAGNILGDEQSGHVREVGIELYQEMLKEAVAEVDVDDTGKPKAEAEQWTPVINMGTAVLIPDTYVEDLTVRLSLYRRIAATESKSELDELSAELIDRFGEMPGEVKNLLDTISIKMLCRQANIAKLDAGAKGISVTFKNQTFSNPGKLIKYIASKQGAMQLSADHRLLIKEVLPLSARAKMVRQNLEKLVALTR